MLHVCRRHAGDTDASRVARLLQEARDVAFHLDSVRTHKVHCRTKTHRSRQTEACVASCIPFGIYICRKFRRPNLSMLACHCRNCCTHTTLVSTDKSGSVRSLATRHAAWG